MSVTAASSREPIRNVSSSPPSTNRTVTTMPGPATPASGGGRCADLGVAQQLVQLADPRLHLALLVLGRVIAAVLLEVALGAGRGDPRRDLGTTLAGEVQELGIQAVVGVLGQPRLGRVAHPKQATCANRDTIGT